MAQKLRDHVGKQSATNRFVSQLSNIVLNKQTTNPKIQNLCAKMAFEPNQIIHQAVALNNHGVDLLKTGAAREAAALFMQGLELLEDTSDAEEVNNTSQIDQTTSSSIQFGPTVPIPGLEDETFYIYNRAIKLTIPALVGQGEVGQWSFMTYCISVLLFNAALVIHLKATLSSGQNKKNLFSKAFALYQNATFLSIEGGAFDFLYLVCTNNQAHLLTMMNAYTETADVLGMLPDILRSVSDHALDPVLMAEVTLVLDEIALNVTIGGNPLGASAA